MSHSYHQSEKAATGQETCTHPVHITIKINVKKKSLERQETQKKAPQNEDIQMINKHEKSSKSGSASSAVIKEMLKTTMTKPSEVEQRGGLCTAGECKSVRLQRTA